MRLMLSIALCAAALLAGCAPTPDFTAEPSGLSAPLKVTFKDTTEVVGGLGLDIRGLAPITAWKWDFGDGNTSEEQNPVHIYYKEGTFDVALSVTNAGGTETITRPAAVTAVSAVSFSASPSAGNAPLTVKFADTSKVPNLDSDPVQYWEWDFGDGTKTTQKDPSNIFSKPGLYTATLRVTSASKRYTGTASHVITVRDPSTGSTTPTPTPAVTFTVDQTVGVAPLTVQFHDTTVVPDPAKNPIIEWAWDFGDTRGSTERDPQHTYQLASSTAFTVKLTIKLKSGTSYSGTTAGLIHIEPGAPVAQFKAEKPREGLLPLAVQFSDLSIPGAERITAWQWSFGDGAGSTAQYPSHTYTEAGAFDVSLTVTTTAGASTEKKTGYIIVTEKPTANFTMNPPSGPKPLTVQFADTSDPGKDPRLPGMSVLTWLWDFGDNYTDARASSPHTFTQSGAYTVSLTVTSPTGSDTKKLQVVAGQLPKPNFTANTFEGNAPLTVYFTDLSQKGDDDITSWDWDFGDKQPHSTDQNPAHIYAVAGTYTASLTVGTAVGAPSRTTTVRIVTAH